jgi:hypothetical protein
MREEAIHFVCLGHPVFADTDWINPEPIFKAL